MMMTRRPAAKKKSADLESEESEEEQIKVAPLSKKEEADILAEFAELDYMARVESAKDVVEVKEAKAEESVSLSLERPISTNMQETVATTNSTTITAPMTTSTAPMASAAMETAEMAPVTGEQLTTNTSAPMRCVTSSGSLYPDLVAAAPRYSAPKQISAQSVEVHSAAHYSAPPMQAQVSAYVSAHVMPQPSAYNPYSQGKATQVGDVQLEDKLRKAFSVFQMTAKRKRHAVGKFSLNSFVDFCLALNWTRFPETEEKQRVAHIYCSAARVTPNEAYKLPNKSMLAFSDCVSELTELERYRMHAAQCESQIDCMEMADFKRVFGEYDSVHLEEHTWDYKEEVEELVQPTDLPLTPLFNNSNDCCVVL